MRALRAAVLTGEMLAADAFLRRVTRTIVEHLGPRRVVLFGSRARGTQSPESDYDIMIELETELPTDEVEDRVYDLLPDQEGSIEVVVYTPDEVRRWQDDVGNILYDIVREGRMLYCRPGVGNFDVEPSDAAAARVREGANGAPASLRSWVDRAQDDFVAMEAIASLQQPPLGIVCFHAHQCVEKLLKACLIARSIRPPRTHDLPELLRACRRAGFDFWHLRGSCRTLQRLYPRSRYPKGRQLTGREAMSAIRAATMIRNTILPLLADAS